ncbi:hypothetical protein [Sphingobacterium humi]|uniref:Neutral/alkaline non-lysosomal ceramidase N-terminal domain-containing protein n=1 Tax=Sphingobacterium humi TaxID=1796905 RepID=A0A6N8L6S0_9SPHI|nr:hypothetical protein [Sphingobacterium humi]MVZ63888.1 hypothetical protein [Sphingobacterium humi]
MRIFLMMLYLCCGLMEEVHASDFYIGRSSKEITPQTPIALMGQFPIRISTQVETPLYVNILALESREGSHSKESSVLVSCDLLYIPNNLRSAVRREVQKLVPSLDTAKVILNATHIHTGPVLEEVAEQYAFGYAIPKEGVVQVQEYVTFLVGQICKGIQEAWSNRTVGELAWGVERAAIGYNRRSLYNNGTSVLYGKTDRPDFKGLEGGEDHDVQSVFFWDKANKLIAIAIEVPCPAQEVESRVAVNADYWDPLRKLLKRQYGEDVAIVALIGASGDLSPHRMYRKAAIERMNKLKNLTALENIARQVYHAVEETYKAVQYDREQSPIFMHKYEVIPLPMRQISKAEYVEASKQYQHTIDLMAKDPKAKDDYMAKSNWHKGLMKRYERLQKNPNSKLDSEIHVIRLGDIAICTNQFELFTDYSIQIQAKSKALQTLVVQLAGAGTYLPTQKAIYGGGYSAVGESDIVGAAGGEALVKRTVELINSCWPTE